MIVKQSMEEIDNEEYEVSWGCYLNCRYSPHHDLYISYGMCMFPSIICPSHFIPPTILSDILFHSSLPVLTLSEIIFCYLPTIISFLSPCHVLVDRLKSTK
jgi:hypothetical protein